MTKSHKYRRKRKKTIECNGERPIQHTKTQFNDNIESVP